MNMAKQTAGITKTKRGHYTVWMAHSIRTFSGLSCAEEARRVLALVKAACSVADATTRDRMLSEIAY
jgi:hypothetical protein